MGKLEVRLLKHTCRAELDRYLRLYSRSFNPDERVSPQILRWVIQPSPARVNPVHLFAAYLDKRLVGGACTLVLPMFQVVFGSYIFVDPALRGRGLGVRILREVLRQERKGPHGWNWRLYGEVTAIFRRLVAQTPGQGGLPLFQDDVAASFVSASQQSGAGPPLLFQFPQTAGTVFSARPVDLHPCPVLRTRSHAPPPAATAQAFCKT